MKKNRGAQKMWETAGDNSDWTQGERENRSNASHSSQGKMRVGADRGEGRCEGRR